MAAIFVNEQNAFRINGYQVKHRKIRTPVAFRGGLFYFVRERYSILNISLTILTLSGKTPSLTLRQMMSFLQKELMSPCLH